MYREGDLLPLEFRVLNDHMFSVPILDTSMQPTFNIGDLAIVDNRISPYPGSFVAVELLSENIITIRRYRASEYAEIEYELIAENSDWPKLKQSTSARLKLLGTLVEHRCKRQLNTPPDLD